MPGMFTWGEVFGIAGHAVKGGRQVVKNGHESGDGGHGDRSDRIYDKAQERRERNAQATLAQLERADNDLARAEAALAAARGPEKAAARRVRNDAKNRQRRADSAARKFR